MRHLRTARPARRIGLLVTGALCLVTGGAAYAAISSSGGTINGCYQKNNGQLRIIDPATDSCRTSEVAITWNQVGPTGPAGATGATGATGPAGSGGALAYAYVDHGALDQGRSKNVVSMAIKPTVNGDVYCFDLTSTPVNVVVNRAAGSGNSGSATPTVAGTSAMALLPCDTGTSAAVISGTGQTSSFFALFN